MGGSDPHFHTNTSKGNAMATEQQLEIFTIEFATLAREIAMDIFDIPDILKLHQLSDVEWAKIQENPRFQAMLKSMILEWNSASNTRERVKVKAATGLESMLEVYIRDINDDRIPLIQRVEAGKFLAKLGELGPEANVMGAGGSAVTINISTGSGKEMITLEGTLGGVIPEEDSGITPIPEDAYASALPRDAERAP
jgi:hypothetical protein